MSESANQLTVVVEQNGLAVESAQTLIDAFQPVFGAAQALVIEANAIQVTDATQVTEIKKARAMRLKLKDIRVKTEHARKALKEDSLRQGKAIDGIANVIKYLVEPVENRLLEQEQFAERAEAERKAKLTVSRSELLAPFGVDASYYQLGDMPEATFTQLLESSRLAHETKLEMARKAEAERVAAEAARIAEEVRIREENAELKREAEEQERAAKAERERVAAEQRAAQAKADNERRAVEAKAAAVLKAAQDKARAERDAAEAKARTEREAAEAVARKEREAREALEAKVRAEQESAQRQADAEARAKKAAELAPDKEKLVAFAGTLRAITTPSLTSTEGSQAVKHFAARIQELAEDIEAAASALATQATRTVRPVRQAVPA